MRRSTNFFITERESFSVKTLRAIERRARISIVRHHNSVRADCCFVPHGHPKEGCILTASAFQSIRRLAK